MQRQRVLAAGVAVAGLITGCDTGIFGTGCDLSSNQRFVSKWSTPSAALGLRTQRPRAVARDGAYSDTASVDPLGAFLAHGRAGTYALTVEHSAYRPWGRNGVRVREGECAPEQVTIIARLQRGP